MGRSSVHITTECCHTFCNPTRCSIVSQVCHFYIEKKYGCFFHEIRAPGVKFAAHSVFLKGKDCVQHLDAKKNKSFFSVFLGFFTENDGTKMGDNYTLQNAATAEVASISEMLIVNNDLFQCFEEGFLMWKMDQSKRIIENVLECMDLIFTYMLDAIGSYLLLFCPAVFCIQFRTLSGGFSRKIVGQNKGK